MWTQNQKTSVKVKLITDVFWFYIIIIHAKVMFKI